MENKGFNKESSEYPGIAKDIADKDEVTDALVDEETEEMNNNPRNDDL